MTKLMMLGAGRSGFKANAVQFTGSSGRMGSNPLLSATTGNSKKFILSFWIYPVSTVTGAIFLGADAGSGNARLSAAFTSSDRLTLSAQNAAGTDIVTWVSQTFAFTANQWQHVVWAVDTDTAGTPRQQIYRNGVALTAGASSLTNDGIVGTIGRMHVPGTSPNTDTMYLAELYFNSGAFLDMATNITRFRSAGGKPVNLGTDGSRPTGSAPYAYFKNKATNFHVNEGTGDDLVPAGSLSDVAGP